MDAKSLQRFLYIDSQLTEDAEMASALSTLFEDLANVTTLTVNTKPLEDALDDLGIDASTYTLPSESRTAIAFESPDEFHQAWQIISDLTNVSKLAELGWVALPTGDQASSASTPKLTIYFTEVSVPDNLNKKDDKVPNLDDLLKQARSDDSTDSGMYDADGSKK